MLIYQDEKDSDFLFLKRNQQYSMFFMFLISPLNTIQLTSIT